MPQLLAKELSLLLRSHGKKCWVQERNGGQYSAQSSGKNPSPSNTAGKGWGEGNNGIFFQYCTPCLWVSFFWWAPEKKLVIHNPFPPVPKSTQATLGGNRFWYTDTVYISSSFLGAVLEQKAEEVNWHDSCWYHCFQKRFEKIAKGRHFSVFSLGKYKEQQNTVPIGKQSVLVSKKKVPFVTIRVEREEPSLLADSLL